MGILDVRLKKVICFDKKNLKAREVLLTTHSVTLNTSMSLVFPISRTDVSTFTLVRIGHFLKLNIFSSTNDLLDVLNYEI